MKIRNKLDRIWRSIESFHTLIWIFPSIGTALLAVLGAVQQVPLYWLISISILVWAALIYLFEKLYWQFGFCPMQVAALKTYEDLKHLGVGSFAKGFDKSGKDVLNEVAMALALEMPVYGCEPPSTKLEQMPERIFTQGNFHDDGKTFYKFDDEHPEFVGICVRRIDLIRTIRNIRNRTDN